MRDNSPLVLLMHSSCTAGVKFECNQEREFHPNPTRDRRCIIESEFSFGSHCPQTRDSSFFSFSARIVKCYEEWWGVRECIPILLLRTFRIEPSLHLSLVKRSETERDKLHDTKWDSFHGKRSTTIVMPQCSVSLTY